MKTPTQKSHSIPSNTKRNIALEALSSSKPISHIAEDYNCSRTAVYTQRDIAIQATNEAFKDKDDSAVLFYIPVSKHFIHQVIVALLVVCKSSYRDTQLFLQTIFNYDVSIGNITNVISDAARTAATINSSYDLSIIETSASDEIYHQNKPILVTVDINSRYCAQATRMNSRKQDDWSLCISAMTDQNYNPTTVVVDSAKGMTNGYAEILPQTVLRYDHFHIIKAMFETKRYLNNKLASSQTKLEKLNNKLSHIKDEVKITKICQAIKSLSENVITLTTVHAAFSLLVNWLQHDVLQLAGYEIAKRSELFDFIVGELERLVKLHPHRVDAIVKSLKYQRDNLLEVANTLNAEFAMIAKEYHVGIDHLWEMCYLTRYSYSSPAYHSLTNKFEVIMGEAYDEIENRVFTILDNTHRTSSMIENFNSRLRPYLAANKTITQQTLDLIVFYLNHKPFLRSAHQHLVGKTPAQALTGKDHLPWHEMLGFQSWYTKQAA